MKTERPVEFKPETAAEAYLGLLAARGVEYLFANAGTDFAPIAEAYAKGQQLGWRLPEPVIVPHENLGVAMAHGYTMVTGRAQAMMVHVGVGSANALNGLINASRQNIPLLFTAGRTPLTEGLSALPGSRNNYINWAQEHFDQGGMLREFVKWDYELKHAEQVETVVDRALAIANSEPAGPVYLTLPREILASPVAGATIAASPTQVAASAPLADPGTLDEVAKLLAVAAAPLIITANGGRSLESARALQRIAEECAIPVIHYRPRYLALSTEHPMQAGWDPHALLEEADLVLVVDCDVPWIPSQGAPQPEAKVVHIGTDPLFARYPLRGFRTDVALSGLVAPTLDALRERVAQRAPPRDKLERRRKDIEARSAAARAKARGGIEAVPARITSKWACACLNMLLGADSLVINEYPLVLEEQRDRRAGTLLGARALGGPRLGPRSGARREARVPGQDCGVRSGRRRLHVRQPDAGAFRVRGDAPAGAVAGVQQRALGRGAPRDAVDLSQRPGRGPAAAAVRRSRALAALREDRRGEWRPRRARHRAQGPDACARARDAGGARGAPPGARQHLPRGELREDELRAVPRNVP